MTIIKMICLLLVVSINIQSKSKDALYYVNLAKKNLEEVIKLEGTNILVEYNSSNFTGKLKKNNYKRVIEILSNQKKIEDRIDTMLILSTSRIIGSKNREDLECENDKWNNLLTYAVYVCLLQSEDQNIRSFVANTIWNNQCKKYLQIFSEQIKNNIDGSIPFYWELISSCNLNTKERLRIIDRMFVSRKYGLLIQMGLDSIEKAEISNRLKNTIRYDYRARFGDKEAESILLSKFDSVKTIKEKLKYAEELSIAKTDATIMMLLKMLDDTTNIVIVPGVTESIRNKILIILKKVFERNELFDDELRATWAQDRQETDTGRANVNKYFNKIADWAKLKYDIELHNLRKANYLMTGYLIPIRMW